MDFGHLYANWTVTVAVGPICASGYLSLRIPLSLRNGRRRRRVH